LIAFIDSDDLWLPAKLGKQVELISVSRQIGLVYCWTAFFESTSGQIVAEGRSSFGGFVLEELLVTNFIGSPSPVVRREVFERVGGFDEDRDFADDWGMWLRIAREYRFGVVPEFLCLYRVHSSEQSKKPVSQYEHEVKTFLLPFIAGLNQLSPRCRRRALANVYAIIGEAYLNRGMGAEARSNYVRACMHLLSWTLLSKVVYLYVSTESQQKSYARMFGMLVNCRLGIQKGEPARVRSYALAALKVSAFLDVRAYIYLVLSFLPPPLSFLFLLFVGMDREGAAAKPYLRDEFVLRQY